MWSPSIRHDGSPHNARIRLMIILLLLRLLLTTTTREPRRTIRRRDDEQPMRQRIMPSGQTSQLGMAPLHSSLPNPNPHAIQDGRLTNEGGLVARATHGMQTAQEPRQGGDAAAAADAVFTSTTSPTSTSPATTAAATATAPVATTTARRRCRRRLAVQDVCCGERVRLREAARDQLEAQASLLARQGARAGSVYVVESSGPFWERWGWGLQPEDQR